MKRVIGCLAGGAFFLLIFANATANAQDQQQIKNEIRKHQEAINRLEQQLRNNNQYSVENNYGENSGTNYGDYSAGESTQDPQNATPRRKPPKFDKDNNPPGTKGGPGTNWENPAGPKGGPGTSPDRRPPGKKFDNDNNPPGPKGGPGKGPRTQKR